MGGALTTQLFPYGFPVTGEELVGREEILRQILQDLRGGQHLLLPGLRRTGKSSVILEALRQLKKEGYLTVYVDISTANTKRELSREIVAATVSSNDTRLTSLLKATTTKLKTLLQFKEFKLAYKEFELVATLYDPHSDEDEQLAASLDFPEQFAAKKEKKLVCAFDEFGEIDTVAPDLIRKMRAAFQHHRHCTYLFTGSQESILQEMFSNPKEPFFGFTKHIVLPPLSTSVFARYIEQKLTKASFVIDFMTAFELCRWVNTHPFYTKVFANAVYEHAALSHIKAIDQSVLEAGYRKAFLQLKDQLEAVWFDLGKSSRFLRQVVCHLAIDGPQSLFSKEGLKQVVESSHIAQALRQLEQKGIVKKIERGHYIFENYFFRDFVLSQMFPDHFEAWKPPPTLPPTEKKK